MRSSGTNLVIFYRFLSNFVPNYRSNFPLCCHWPYDIMYHDADCRTAEPARLASSRVCGFLFFLQWFPAGFGPNSCEENAVQCSIPFWLSFCIFGIHFFARFPLHKMTPHKVTQITVFLAIPQPFPSFVHFFSFWCIFLDAYHRHFLTELL